jgi:Zinc finger, C3HC4 type (RING finger)
MLLIQVSVQALMSLVRFLKARELDRLSRAASTHDDTDALSSRDCILCLSQRQFTTAAPCGHLFCWNCIHRAVRDKVSVAVCFGVKVDMRIAESPYQFSPTLHLRVHVCVCVCVWLCVCVCV